MRFFPKNDHFWPKNHMIFWVDPCGEMLIFWNPLEKKRRNFFSRVNSEDRGFEPKNSSKNAILKSMIPPRGPRARARVTVDHFFRDLISN